MKNEWIDRAVKVFVVLCGLLTVGIVLYNAVSTPKNAAPGIRYYSETYLAKAGEEEMGAEQDDREDEPWNSGFSEAEEETPAYNGRQDGAAKNVSSKKTAGTSLKKTSSRKTSSGKTSSKRTSSKKTSSRRASSKNAGSGKSSSRQVSSGDPEPFNVNTATYEQLVAIDGIGDATARNILEFRDKCGGFTYFEELLNVKGIGEARLKLLEQYCYVSPIY